MIVHGYYCLPVERSYLTTGADWLAYHGVPVPSGYSRFRVSDAQLYGANPHRKILKLPVRAVS